MSATGPAAVEACPVCGSPMARGERYRVQVLARHQMVERVLADVAQDMQICRIEGWDVWEYPRMLRDAIPAPPKGVG